MTPPPLNSTTNSNPVTLRRKLLPLWIKIIIWYFMIISVFVLLVPALQPAKIIGEVELDYFGLKTNAPFSLTGLFIYTLALLTGSAELLLWLGKKWAVKLAIFQGSFCLLLVVFNLILIQKQIIVSRNFVYVLLIPYLLTLIKIRKDWEAIN